MDIGTKTQRGGAGEPRPRALLTYHFFHPDEVVSARLFSELALGLTARGWAVTALTSTRCFSEPKRRFGRREQWGGIGIERVDRPAWDQRRPVQRLANSAWMLGGWLTRAARLGAYDAVVLGSDPAFAALLFVPLRRLWPTTVLAHWCFDLYPEAIAADGGGRVVEALLPVGRWCMAQAYGACDAIADLGPRMRERLATYPSAAERTTLHPWALVESQGLRDDEAHARVRRQLFGGAKLGLLYSGTLGRAHDFAAFLTLARACRARSGDAIGFCFAARGHGMDALRSALVADDDVNIRLAAFGNEDELAERLDAADVHLLSLKAQWSGIVVPSKFFGALAAGRPVLYAGPADSDVARFIRELDVGWNLHDTPPPDVPEILHELIDAPDRRARVMQRAREAYVMNFKKDLIIDRWDRLLRDLMRTRQTGAQFTSNWAG